MKLAIAPFHHRPLHRVETPAAAHQFAAVRRVGRRRTVARPAASAERSGSRVRLAEVRRGAEVDEVGVGRLAEPGRACHQFATRSAASLLDLDGRVESLAQDGADLAERRHRPPAGLQLARPRHAVTLALYANVIFYCL